MLPDSKIAEIFFVIDEFFHVFDATGKEADDMTFKPFFSIGARYKRIRKRPRESFRGNSTSTKLGSCQSLNIR